MDQFLQNHNPFPARASESVIEQQKRLFEQFAIEKQETERLRNEYGYYNKKVEVVDLVNSPAPSPSPSPSHQRPPPTFSNPAIYTTPPPIQRNLGGIAIPKVTESNEHKNPLVLDAATRETLRTNAFAHASHQILFKDGDDHQSMIIKNAMQETMKEPNRGDIIDFQNKRQRYEEERRNLRRHDLTPLGAIPTRKERNFRFNNNGLTNAGMEAIGGGNMIESMLNGGNAFESNQSRHNAAQTQARSPPTEKRETDQRLKLKMEVLRRLRSENRVDDVARGKLTKLYSILNGSIKRTEENNELYVTIESVIKDCSQLRSTSEATIDMMFNFM